MLSTNMLSPSLARCSFQLDLQVRRNLMSDPWWGWMGVGDVTVSDLVMLGIPTKMHHLVRRKRNSRVSTMCFCKSSNPALRHEI